MKETSFNQTVYSIEVFLSVDVKTWGERLKEHHLHCMHQPASGSQRKAWFDCFNILRSGFEGLPQLPKDTYLIFEYELPRERGRRPDVLLLSGNNLLVIEFKGYAQETQAQIDQVKHYARDLRHYHLKSHDLNVVPILVLAQGSGIRREMDGVMIVTGDQLSNLILPLINDPFLGIDEWYKSEYSPLPSLVQAAQLLFKTKKFPQIKRSQSAGIPQILEILHNIAKESKRENTHHLALITGVPGAGKTLVGLQFVFEEYVQEKEQKAVFLSGNGPLVQVLQRSLSNNHFVQSIHGFLKQYAHSKISPKEDVIIYDEAQRAWDAEKVTSSNRYGNNSEPVDFINIAERKDCCLIIGLIGEGQEIHLGEESGMGLWTEAISETARQWKVHCPQKISKCFSAEEVIVEESFDLTTSLRTHQALTLQKWVENLLDGNITEARGLFHSLFDEGYPIYISRSLESAKAYVKVKYEGELDKTYGLIASSKSRILPNFGVKNDYDSTKAFNVAQYYVEENHSAYCKNFISVVTEFGCQGLELDMPILAWETDYVFEGSWKNLGPNKKAKNPDNLKKNAYRVLLTRGRDGLVIFVPDNRILDSTFKVLLDAGCHNLKK